MGVLYELNWYLVVANENEIKNVTNERYATIKSEKRIYPINSPLPIIIKDKGCIGIVEIMSFKVEDERTEIEFRYVENLDVNSIVSKHYYEMYTKMKNN